MLHRKLRSLLGAALLSVTLVSTAAAATTVPGAVYGPPKVGPGKGETTPAGVTASSLSIYGVKDVTASHWAAGSLVVLMQAGLLAPDGNGNVKPDQPLTAAQGVAVFAKVLGIASKTDTPEQALAKAKQAGIAKAGMSGGAPLRRVEVAVLLATALGVQPSSKPITPANYPFADYATTDPADRAILAALYELGVFRGYEDGTFRPDNVLTTAEIAILVDRILGAPAR